jgi:sugar phosphate isomerase/epimerase
MSIEMGVDIRREDCGHGVIDWSRVIAILRQAGYRGVLSVECGTPDQAARSLRHLGALLAGQPEVEHALAR